MLKKCFSNKKFVVGFIILVPLIIVMIFGNFLVPNDPYALDTVNMLKNSSAKYPLGTDEYGRCILTCLILGIRPSMMVALGGTAISFAGGTLLGVAAGYLEGRIGAVIMRGIDIILCFPPILLAMIIAGLWGAGVINLMLVIGLLYIPHFSRVAYSSTLQVRKMEYVESDLSIGAAPSAIMWKAIFPNIISVLIVQVSTTISNAILLESGLSFLGLGVQPPTPSWGQMIGSARGYLNVNVMYLFWPAVCLCLTILAVNLMGDAIRDILDPKLNNSF